MKEIWLICSGCYSDIHWHGFVETEEEAKTYCEWRNQYLSDDWDRMWYSRVPFMSIQMEPKTKQTVYKIFTEKDQIITEDIEVELVEQGTKHSYEMRYFEEPDWFSCEFAIVCDSKERAIKIAQDTLAQLKEKYVECEDWCLAMESIGGFVW